jgi:antitoxin component YwqK of YwqJK toxin-antitoxin module
MVMTMSREYYDNGQLLCEVPFPYNESIRHGVARWWYQNGQLNLETLYHEGLKHGVEKWWYDNGQIECEHIYHEGQLHGIERNWYKNGQLESEEYYLYGSKVTKEEYDADDGTSGV